MEKGIIPELTGFETRSSSCGPVKSLYWLRDCGSYVSRWTLYIYFYSNNVAMWFSLELYGMGHSLHSCHVIQPAWTVWNGPQSALLPCDTDWLGRMEWASLHCCHVIKPAWAVWNRSQSALLPCDSACMNRTEWVTVCIVAVFQPAWTVWNGPQFLL
jgi:hypothetical protein